MRLDALEREALKYALNDFDGDAYLLVRGSMIRKGVGILISFLVPKREQTRLNYLWEFRGNSFQNVRKILML